MQSQSPTLTPTAPPRDAWTVVRVVEAARYARVVAVAEARGKLFALGSAGFEQPGIWVSEDGVTSGRADIPAAPADLGFNVLDLVDTGERLVALAPGGSSEGSGYFATMILTSEDGDAWSEAVRTPGPRDGAHFSLVRVGDRLVAMGHSVWVSDDAGLTWSVASDREEVRGTMLAAGEHDGLIVAVGQTGTSDVVELPALVWTSSDGGDTWQRIELPYDRPPHAVVVGQDGRIVIGISASDTAPIWTSDDGGQSWSPGDPRCCLAELVVTPTGYAAIFTGLEENAPVILTSIDGLDWVEHPLAFEPIDTFSPNAAEWLPSFGLVLVVQGESIAFAPNPLP